MLMNIQYITSAVHVFFSMFSKNFALKQLKKGGTWTESVDTKEINWYPLQKISFARKKLEGANPSVILW